MGFHYMFTETVLALLRNPESWHSVYSKVDAKSDTDDVGNQFKELLIEERAKVDGETLVNVDNVKKRKTPTHTSDGFHKEYIVITIVVAADGGLPVIDGRTGSKDALLKLGSISADKFMAVEVLWTPQDENDALSEEELLEDYPYLRPL